MWAMRNAMVWKNSIHPGVNTFRLFKRLQTSNM